MFDFVCIIECYFKILHNIKMKIPKQLPQFEKPALFISAGEYEAKFYIAQNGILEKTAHIKMPPRKEAKEKQGFIGKRAAKKDLASVSHKGRYLEDLKRKFKREVHRVIHKTLAEYKLKEIYIFAPVYAVRRIESQLDKSERKNIRMRFFKEDTKFNALNMVVRSWEEEQKEVFPGSVAKNSAKKILKKPKIKNGRKHKVI